jgi:hypothetical protein
MEYGKSRSSKNIKPVVAAAKCEKLKPTLMPNLIKIMNTTRFTFYILLATLVWTAGCSGLAHHSDPLAGWKGGTSAYVGCPFDQTIIDDYRNYIQTLPPEERGFVRDSNIRFYEGEGDQRAVEISIPINGTWWKHVLIYDKESKRIKMIRYASGRYAS